MYSDKQYNKLNEVINYECNWAESMIYLVCPNCGNSIVVDGERIKECDCGKLYGIEQKLYEYEEKQNKSAIL